MTEYVNPGRQPMLALERANAARHGPVAFRQRLRSLSYRDAVLEAARVLMEEPEMVGSKRVYRFLEEVPEIGWSKARTMLVRHGIYAAKPVRELTERQRGLLGGELVRHAAMDRGRGHRWEGR